MSLIEEQYGFEFDDADLQELQADATLGDLVRIIKRRAGGTVS